jgi:hypothetical protein
MNILKYVTKQMKTGKIWLAEGKTSLVNHLKRPPIALGWELGEGKGEGFMMLTAETTLWNWQHQAMWKSYELQQEMMGFVLPYPGQENLLFLTMK